MARDKGLGHSHTPHQGPPRFQSRARALGKEEEEEEEEEKEKEKEKENFIDTGSGVVWGGDYNTHTH
jgi:ribosomal protein L12E/L44/L45/RPP1/RPP2